MLRRGFLPLRPRPDPRLLRSPCRDEKDGQSSEGGWGEGGEGRAREPAYVWGGRGSARASIRVWREERRNKVLALLREHLRVGERERVCMRVCLSLHSSSSSSSSSNRADTLAERDGVVGAGQLGVWGPCWSAACASDVGVGGHAEGSRSFWGT